ncbi:MAG: hypothetical protein OHK0029_12360 [Armatimonadaceae bacterium]
MQINIEKNNTSTGNVVVVALDAEKLDISNSARFKKLMEPIVAENNKIVLDLEKVSFMDSSGFGAILGFLRELSERGGDIKLCQVQKRVRILLEMVRIHKIVSILNTREDAVRAFETA